MRSRLLAAAVLGLSMVSGCGSGVESVGGEAGPAGSPTSPATAASPSATPSTTRTPSVPTTSAGGDSRPGGSSAVPRSEIRRTDWANVSLGETSFLDGTLRFRNGKATVGDTTCTMLPGGARPVYGHFLTEEPANSPSTEDGLVLVDCDGDQRQQALLMVQIGYDQKTRGVNAHIPADPSDGSDRRMTFLSYSLDEYDIVVTVRKADGSTERRRYRHNGGANWGRV